MFLKNNCQNETSKPCKCLMILSKGFFYVFEAKGVCFWSRFYVSTLMSYQSHHQRCSKFLLDLLTVSTEQKEEQLREKLKNMTPAKKKKFLEKQKLKEQAQKEKIKQKKLVEKEKEKERLKKEKEEEKQKRKFEREKVNCLFILANLLAIKKEISVQSICCAHQC